MDGWSDPSRGTGATTLIMHAVGNCERGEARNGATDIRNSHSLVTGGRSSHTHEVSKLTGSSFVHTSAPRLGGDSLSRGARAKTPAHPLPVALRTLRTALIGGVKRCINQQKSLTLYSFDCTFKAKIKQQKPPPP